MQFGCRLDISQYKILKLYWNQTFFIRKVYQQICFTGKISASILLFLIYIYIYMHIYLIILTILCCVMLALNYNKLVNCFDGVLNIEYSERVTENLTYFSSIYLYWSLAYSFPSLFQLQKCEKNPLSIYWLFILFLRFWIETLHLWSA